MADNSKLFVQNPVGLDISRSKFDLSHAWSGTFNAGQCIPCLAYSDVLPGDTFKINAQIVIRSTTPIAPIMDQAYADLYYFFVPHKLVLGRESMSTATTDGIHSFEAFIGAQDSLLNMPLPGNQKLPTCGLGAGLTNRFVGSFADYIGINGFNLTNKVKVTPFEALAYAKVWNDYFRDPNTMTPLSYAITGGEVYWYGGTGSLNGIVDINDVSYKFIQPVCRYHGYFGSALPWPQRNSTSVTLPLGLNAPVKLFASSAFSSNDTAELTTPLGINIANQGIVQVQGTGGSSGSGYLQADLQNAIAPSVNAFRLAVQTQRWYEAVARSGNRLANLTQLLGVTPHDVTADTPEYLGGLHIPLSLTQVANTSGTTYSTATQQAIGSTGAFSLTSDNSYICTKSFDTWGTVIAIICIRPHESFCQGIHRRFFRDDRLKYYWPQFANLGEQYIEEREIYAKGDAYDTTVFGYQEAWAEYRFLPDVVTGLLRPNVFGVVSGAMPYWTYCNNFSSAPSLQGYLNGDNIKSNFDQTLQVPSSTAGFQFEAQVNHRIDAIRPLPTYSIPGLVDHH